MPKGFDGWLAIVSETNGWGSSAVGTSGAVLYLDSESINPNKTFKDQPEKITWGRALKVNSRVDGEQKPGGDLQFQFRSDDCINPLMAHFQKYTATNIGGAGTAFYTFVPTKGEPDWVGSTWGTGGYTSANGDMFTVGVVKKYYESLGGTYGSNAQWYNSCFVDEMKISCKAGEDAKMMLKVKAYGVDPGTTIALNPPAATIGSYSSKSAYQYFSGTFLFGGDSLDISSIEITTSNKSEDRTVLGRKNPRTYPFGRFEVGGQIEIDLPKDHLKYVERMLDNGTFSVVGTFYTSDVDMLSINIPICKMDDFKSNLSAGNANASLTIPFIGYESADGSTAPITVVVKNTGWGTILNKL